MEKNIKPSPELLKLCENIAILEDALEKNGIKKSDAVRFERMDDRVKVTVNGEYYGIWDINRRTFVD
jgi:hypothetical protein